jgi:hypothetical protein
MSLIVSDLLKIKEKTSYNPKLKKTIAIEVIDLKAKIEKIKLLPTDSQKEAFIELRNPYEEAKQKAYHEGANSYASPTWALPTICEAYIYAYIKDNENEIIEVNKIIDELSDPNRPEEGDDNHGFKFLILIAVSALIFYYFTWYYSLIIFIVGNIILGWKRRHVGPFNAK